MDAAGRVGRAVGAAAAVLATVGCYAPGAGNRDPSEPAQSAADRTAAAPASQLPRPTASVPRITLPTLVGRGLQVAQDAAQAAGSRAVRSHDALGLGRAQVLDRDWKVCFSSPPPGPVVVDTVVELAAVKTTETCPPKDLGLPVATDAPATMPNLVGKSLRVAQEALGLDTTIQVQDARSDRSIILAPNWQVCTQRPAAGTPFGAGVSVALTVVKFGETC